MSLLRKGKKKELEKKKKKKYNWIFACKFPSWVGIDPESWLANKVLFMFFILFYYFSKKGKKMKKKKSKLKIK